MMEELLAVLGRIANALEESNRINAQWFEVAQAQRIEGTPMDQRLLALHEQNSEREETWRNEQRPLLSLHAQEVQQRIALNENLLSLQKGKGTSALLS